MNVAKDLKFRADSDHLVLRPPVRARFGLWKNIRRVLGKSDVQESKPEDLTAVPIEKITDMIAFLTKIQASDRGTISITVNTADSATSVVLANLIAETFISEVMSKDQQEITELQNFILERLKETTEKLKSSELELVHYKQRNNIVSTAENGRKEVDRLGRLESDVEQIKIRIRESERLLGYYQKRLEQKNAEILHAKGSGVDEDEGNTIRNRIEALRKQRTSLRAQGLGESEGVVSELNKNINENTERLRAYAGSLDSSAGDMDSFTIQEKIQQLHTEVKQLNVKLAEVERAKYDLQDTVSVLPKREQEAVSLERTVALHYELYTQLKKRQQEIDIQKAGLKNPVGIESMAQGAHATMPPSLFSRLIFALMAGIFLGSVATILHELLNFTVKHRSDLDAAELINLGNIPFLNVGQRKVRGGQNRMDLLVCANNPESAESMAFKFVRAQLRNLVQKNDGLGQVVTISSADRGAGKSFLSSNLGVAFSQLGKKTIVVDCDIRNPTLPKYFGYENHKGIASLLEMTATLSEVIIREKLPNLDILPAGRLKQNPTELLSGDRFATLLSFLKKKYDYVVLDAPPALFVVDAAVLAAAADVTILVARYRQTKKHDLLTAHRKIVQIAPNVVYGVLNGVQEVHEYTNYDASAYFDGKFRSLKDYLSFREKLQGSGDQGKFEKHLEGNEDPKRKNVA
jgi:capsular exopolysaccharide synthesis family protein